MQQVAQAIVDEAMRDTGFKPDRDVIWRRMRETYDDRMNVLGNINSICKVNVFLDGQIVATAFSPNYYAAICEAMCKGFPGAFPLMIERILANEREWRSDYKDWLPKPCPGLGKLVFHVYKVAPEDVPTLIKHLEPAEQAKVRTALLTFRRMGVPLPLAERMSLQAVAIDYMLTDEEWEKMMLEMWYDLVM